MLTTGRGFLAFLKQKHAPSRLEKINNTSLTSSSRNLSSLPFRTMALPSSSSSSSTSKPPAGRSLRSAPASNSSVSPTKKTNAAFTLLETPVQTTLNEFTRLFKSIQGAAFLGKPLTDTLLSREDGRQDNEEDEEILGAAKEMIKGELQRPFLSLSLRRVLETDFPSFVSFASSHQTQTLRSLPTPDPPPTPVLLPPFHPPPVPETQPRLLPAPPPVHLHPPSHTSNLNLPCCCFQA